jgi:integrase/recombinase XerD
MRTNPETTPSSESIESFLLSLTARGRSEATIKAYGSDLRLFVEWAGPMPDTQNFEAVAAQWLNTFRPHWSPKTTNRRLTTLRAYARWARMETPDLDDYRPPVPGRAVPHPLPEGIPGVLRIIEACRNDRQRAMVALCGLAGLRLHEALGVQPTSVNVQEMELTVRGKGDKTRVLDIGHPLWVWLSPALANCVLERRVYVVDYKDRFARTAITQAAERAGLSRPVSSHDLRATFLTALYDKTLDLRLVQEYAGHASNVTTEVYTGVSRAKTRDAINRI